MSNNNTRYSSDKAKLSEKASFFVAKIETDLINSVEIERSKNTINTKTFIPESVKPPIKHSKRIAVVGSRQFKSLNLIYQWLDYANEKWGNNIVIVSGGAKGVDKEAEKWAINKKINRDIDIPNWGTEGKKAGILRNQEIVKNADFILAFLDGESSGTEYTLNFAKKLNKRCIIVFEDGFYKNW